MRLFLDRLSHPAALAAFILSVSVCSAQTNVALNAPVSVAVVDSFGNYNNSTAGNLQNLTNGVILPDSTAYNSTAATSQAVEWDGNGFIFQITLPTLENLTGVIVDADDNDAYTLTYLNPTTNLWDTLYDAPIVSVGNGLRTRPDTADQSAQFPLVGITTSEVRIQGGASDDNFCDPNGCSQGGYAVGQVELFGSPATVSAVPEPTSITLVATGILGIAGAVRRRIQR